MDLIPVHVMGMRCTNPNMDASFNASVVDANCSNASVCTEGNLYVDSTILLAKMTPREEMA